MRLVNCFIPFFALLQQFQRQPGGDAATLSAQLDAAIADARRNAQDADHAAADVDDALFAVCAWADEILIAANWSGAALWQRTLLQRRYFNISNAGVAFFTRLENLGPQRLPVREVYYLCLGMGFAGRYGYDRNQKALTDIKSANLELLLQGDDGLPGEAGRLMFPDGYGAALSTLSPEPGAPRKSVVRRGWKLSTLTLGALMVPVGVLLVLYGIYHENVSQLVNAILPQISI